MKLLSIVGKDRNAPPTLGVWTEYGVIDVAKVMDAAGVREIVKPVEAAKSMGVAKVRGLSDLHVALTIDELITHGLDGLETLRQLVAYVTSAIPAETGATGATGENRTKGETDFGKLEFESVLFAEDSISIGPVVSKPEKIICVGTNYRRHAIESNLPIPKTPVLFSKFNNALAGHRQVVKIPETAKKIDYEVELVIVMGKRAQNVSVQDALSYVFGYATGNDLSARDLQFTTSQWLLGKTCDGFAPVGPYVVTADEIPDPNHLKLECKVNGEVRQSSNTKDMIFSCASLISYISSHMTLQPGDIIFTGTPEGVILGYPEERQKWLQSGDEIEVSVEGLGSLKTVLA
jgi:2-keto-4-pentenoate hydratase/2-oxohepta-3-ene-1,7-dioic acid hydratase in catechol pathway